MHYVTHHAPVLKVVHDSLTLASGSACAAAADLISSVMPGVGGLPTQEPDCLALHSVFVRELCCAACMLCTAQARGAGLEKVSIALVRCLPLRSWCVSECAARECWRGVGTALHLHAQKSIAEVQINATLTPPLTFSFMPTKTTEQR